MIDILPNDDRRHAGAREVTGPMVLVGLIAFFALVVGANAILIRAAVSTFGGVEMSNSYQAGLAFAREGDEAAAQEALRWQVDARIAPVQGETLIEIEARDSAGVPLTGLAARARLAHPADKRLDRIVELTRTGAGRFEGRSKPTLGQWTLEIELDRDGTRMFRSRNRVFLR